MEEKKYEGIVQITSAEYRELVAEATENKLKYDNAISAKWTLESENRKLKEELDALQKKLKGYEHLYGELPEVIRIG